MEKIMRSVNDVSARVSSAPFTGVDVATRTVYLMSDIDEESAAKFIIGFNALDSTKGAIQVTINSGGGNAVDAYAMFETMRDANNKVITYGIGEVFSAAAVVFQGGQLRVLSPYCRFMVHNGYCGVECEADRLEGRIAEAKVVDHIYRKILADRSGLDLAVVEQLCKEETYMDAEKTVSYNLADGVSEPRRIYVPKAAKNARAKRKK